MIARSNTERRQQIHHHNQTKRYDILKLIDITVIENCILL